MLFQQFHATASAAVSLTVEVLTLVEKQLGSSAAGCLGSPAVMLNDGGVLMNKLGCQTSCELPCSVVSHVVAMLLFEQCIRCAPCYASPMLWAQHWSAGNLMLIAVKCAVSNYLNWIATHHQARRCA